jgi:uncharacterized protein (DUF2147 family)
MKKYAFSFLVFAVGLMAAAFAQPGSPEGTWKTVDDQTGESKSHVRIYEQGGKYYGKIVKLLQSPEDTLCDECKGDKKDKPVLGLVIIEALEPHQDYWKSGTILDPENGNEYRCSVWYEDGNTDELKVRGKHWTGLYRTQTWYRVP